MPAGTQARLVVVAGSPVSGIGLRRVRRCAVACGITCRVCARKGRTIWVRVRRRNGRRTGRRSPGRWRRCGPSGVASGTCGSRSRWPHGFTGTCAPRGCAGRRDGGRLVGRRITRSPTRGGTKCRSLTRPVPSFATRRNAVPVRLRPAGGLRLLRDVGLRRLGGVRLAGGPGRRGLRRNRRTRLVQPLAGLHGPAGYVRHVRLLVRVCNGLGVPGIRVGHAAPEPGPLLVRRRTRRWTHCSRRGLAVVTC